MMALMGFPRYLSRPQRYWWVPGMALVLGLSTYSVHHGLIEPLMLAALMVGAVTLILGVRMLRRQVRLVSAQRNRALSRMNATERKMSDILRNEDRRVEQRVARRVQELESDIANLRAREQLLMIQAHHDGLTGLANRTLLADRFENAVTRAKRRNTSFALLMIDLNDFKSVNDNYGHAAGDAVLVTTAKRLVSAVRASDTVARLGGDEFVLIIESFDNAHELHEISRKLVDRLSESVTLDADVVVNVGASAGVALYPKHGADLNDLLHAADQAMYDCKLSRHMPLR